MHEAANPDQPEFSVVPSPEQQCQDFLDQFDFDEMKAEILNLEEEYEEDVKSVIKGTMVGLGAMALGVGLYSAAETSWWDNATQVVAGAAGIAGAIIVSGSAGFGLLSSWKDRRKTNGSC